MINIAICDDDSSFIATLKTLLNRYAEERQLDLHVLEFRDGTELLNSYNTALDLIFLDIQMDKMDGLETAGKIRMVDSGVSIIFLTSMIQYALEGYQYNATNYIIKPMKYVRLKAEMDRWMQSYRPDRKPFLLVANDTGKYKVFIQDIYYIETFNRNLMIHSSTENILSYKKMKELEKELEKHRFIRCHSGFLVNLFYVKRVEKLELELTNGDKIPISQPKRKFVMEKLADYWGDRL